MIPDPEQAALIAAGAIGVAVAIVHGVLTHRLIASPIESFFWCEERTPAAIRRLTPLLLQFSTFNWLLGGLALIAAALWTGQEARLAIGLLVGSSYLFGAAANLWSTRRFHPGWFLYSIALLLIAFGVAGGG